MQYLSGSPAASKSVRRVPHFSVQVLFSAFLILFSAYKLIIIDSPDPLYVSLLTTTVGVWLPSPLHGMPALTTTSQTSL